MKSTPVIASVDCGLSGPTVVIASAHYIGGQFVGVVILDVISPPGSDAEKREVAAATAQKWQQNNFARTVKIALERLTE